MNPHDHKSILSTLRESKEEVKAMPKPERRMKSPAAPPMMIADEIDHDPLELIPEIHQDPEEEFDLDKEFERISALVEEESQLPPPVTEQPTSPEERLRLQILSYLHEHPNAPTVEDIAAWKKKHGQHAVNVVALDPENVYVYTRLSWPTWDKIQRIAEHARSKGDKDPDKVMRESIVCMGVLWPKITPQFFVDDKTPAGLPSTLSELILAASYFLRPEHALNLTTSL